VVFSSSGASRLWRWRSWNLTGVFGVIRVLRLADRESFVWPWLVILFWFEMSS
jgi:hypothetical protein